MASSVADNAGTQPAAVCVPSAQAIAGAGAGAGAGGPPPNTASSEQRPRQKKKRRKRKREQPVCFDWVAGTCVRGDLCKYSHKQPEKSEALLESQKLLRAQTNQRLTVVRRNKNGPRPVFGADMPRPAFGSVVERYYTQLFTVDVGGKPRHDQYVYMHSNRICVIGVTPSHAMFHCKSAIESVSFAIKGRGEKVQRDLSDLQFSGKKKRGCPTVQEDTVICQVTVADGRVFNIAATIPGKVLEVNLRLMENASTLSSKPLTDGYIAIMAPNDAKVASIQQTLMSREKFHELRGPDSASVAVPSAFASGAAHKAQASPAAAGDA